VWEATAMLGVCKNNYPKKQKKCSVSRLKDVIINIKPFPFPMCLPLIGSRTDTAGSSGAHFLFIFEDKTMHRLA
jgi:hypothetical protein